MLLWIIGVGGSAVATSPCGDSWPEAIVLPAEVDEVPLNLSVPVSFGTACGDDPLSGADVLAIDPEGEEISVFASTASQVWGEASFIGRLEPETEYTLRLARFDGEEPDDVVVVTGVDIDDSEPVPPDPSAFRLEADRWRRAGADELTLHVSGGEAGIRYEALHEGVVVARHWQEPSGVDVKRGWHMAVEDPGETRPACASAACTR